jgi:hypothetical protein
MQAKQLLLLASAERARRFELAVSPTLRLAPVMVVLRGYARSPEPVKTSPAI